MAHLAMNIVSNGGGSDGHMTTAAATSAVDPAAVVALHNDIAELKNRLAARDRHVRQLEDAAEASEDVVAEWQAKYDRLLDAHRKLQKTNNALEDKLLRIVDKFESDKNQMTRDLASQTQKLVQAKMAVQQSRDQNRELQQDLHLSLTLLQNRPSSYLAQRVDSLPHDMRARVKAYIVDRQAEKAEAAAAAASEAAAATSARKITVPIMDEVSNIGDNEKVSAAILAKVLEERGKERSARYKFCIDVGTQTHGWHFPDKIGGSGGEKLSPQAAASTASSTSSFTSSPEEQRVEKSSSSSSARLGTNRQRSVIAGTNSNGEATSSSEVIQLLRSISLDIEQPSPSSAAMMIPGTTGTTEPKVATSSSECAQGSILLTSIIRSPPASMVMLKQNNSNKSTSSIDTISESETSSGGGNDGPKSTTRRPPPSQTLIMTRSATYSAIQTDI